jgi:hypothetical protein
MTIHRRERDPGLKSSTTETGGVVDAFGVVASWLGVRCYGEEVPFPGHALELMSTAGLELEA